MWSEEQQRAARERGAREWLKAQLAHGKGSYALRAMEAAKHARQVRAALSLRQDRNGELAAENMGRAHGCYVQQVTGATAMLDDCDPLEAKMQPAIAAESQRLAAETEGNLGGVHWTSGDVPYQYDAFPMREAHGGYSGLSDISFPADAVYPTVYKPTLGLGPGAYAEATGTKARSPAALHEHGAPGAAAAKNAAGATVDVEEKKAEKKKQELEKKETSVDKALREQHREEAVAATDKAIADKVMKDAMKNKDEEKRTRLLKAATAEYDKAAAATAAAKASKASAAAQSGAVVSGRKTGGADDVSVSMPAAMAKGSVTISFSADGAEDARKAAHDAKKKGGVKMEDALTVAHKLVVTEENLRAEAKALAASEKAKTEAVVARNNELKKELAHIVPDIAK